MGLLRAIMLRLVWGIGTALINGAVIFALHRVNDKSFESLGSNQIILCISTATLVFLGLAFLFNPLKRFSQALILALGAWFLIPFLTSMVTFLIFGAWEKGVITILFAALGMSVAATCVWMTVYFVQFAILVATSALSLYAFSRLLFR